MQQLSLGVELPTGKSTEPPPGPPGAIPSQEQLEKMARGELVAELWICGIHSWLSATAYRPVVHSETPLWSKPAGGYGATVKVDGQTYAAWEGPLTIKDENGSEYLYRDLEPESLVIRVPVVGR